MSSGDEQQTSQFADASEKLDQGLKNCRSVVENYRAMLTGENSAANEDDAGQARTATA